MNSKNGKKANLEVAPIPDEIKARIIELYDTRVDFVRFRSVSPRFRSHLPLPCNSVFPLKVPSLNRSTQSPVTVVLHRQIVYLLTKCRCSSDDNNNTYSQDTFLIKAEEKTNENKLVLFDLMTGRHRCHEHEPINLLNYRVSEIARSYNIDESSLCTSSISKIVASTSSFEFLALRIGGALSWWKLGCKEWYHILSIQSPPYSSQFVDIICYRGVFLALDCQGRLIQINISSKKLEKGRFDFVSYEVIESTRVSLDFISGKTTYLSGMRSTLVESDGHLYLVTVTGTREEEWASSLRYKVCLLDQEENGKTKYWRSVQSFGNKVFFLGRDATFSISARELGLVEGDLIYDIQVVKRSQKVKDDILYDFKNSTIVTPRYSSYQPGLFRFSTLLSEEQKEDE